MAIVDADTHVIETEHTWDFMGASDAQYRPRIVHERMPDGTEKQFWLIDGRLIPRHENEGKDTTEATREMKDIAARLRHMDELGVDVHVLYPSIFLRPVTARAEVELALCRSYNRWLAEIWERGNGRLRWAVMLPFLSMDKAIEELRWAREHGAVSVFMRGFETRHRLVDPYLFPVYAEASRLNMPLGIHSATGNFGIYDFLDDESGFIKFKLAVVGAFHSIVYADLPARFPELRIGFLEVTSQWVPYALNDLMIRFRRRGKPFSGKDVLRENRLYVACQTEDDLEYVLGYTGTDNILIGSDYGHDDTSSELLALQRLKNDGKIDPRVIDKILDDNPRAFYAL